MRWPISPGLLSLAAALLVCSPLPAQRPPIFHTRAALVQVPVIVLDHHGKFVRGLTRDQFNVKVDGKTVPISAIDMQQSPTRPGTPLSPPAPGMYSNRAAAVSARRIILLLDYQHTPVTLLPYLHSELVKWFHQELPPGDQVAIFALDHGLEVLQPFTDNHESLRQAVRHMVVFHNGSDRYHSVQRDLDLLNSMDSSPAASDAAITTPAGANTSDPNATNLLGGSAADAPSTQAALLEMQSLLDRGRYYSTVTALQDLAAVLQGVPGRKTVVWLTSGTSLNVLMNPNLGIRGRRIQQAFEELNQADVGLFPVDVNGLRVFLPQISRASMRGGRMRILSPALAMNAQRFVGMGLAARLTGGQVYANNNGFDHILSHVADITAQAYVLSFVPPAPRKGHPYRSIEVSVRRPRLTLLYRRQYLQPEQAIADISNAGFIAGLSRMAFDPMDMGGLSLALRTSPPGPPRQMIPAGSKKPGMFRSQSFVMVMPYRAVLHARPDGSGGADFDFTCVRLLVPLDDPADVLVFPTGRFQQKLTAAQNAVMKTRVVVYHESFTAPVGHVYLARLLVHDNLTGQMGSVSFRLDMRGKQRAAGSR